MVVFNPRRKRRLPESVLATYRITTRPFRCKKCANFAAHCIVQMCESLEWFGGHSPRPILVLVVANAVMSYQKFAGPPFRVGPEDQIQNNAGLRWDCANVDFLRRGAIRTIRQTFGPELIGSSVVHSSSITHLYGLYSLACGKKGLQILRG